MTTAKAAKFPPDFTLPDVPEIPDEIMTAYDQLTENGSSHYLAQHLGNLETTLVAGGRCITATPPSERPDMTGSVYPDMLVAFDVDPATYRARNGYVISEQGKPPDFVLEVASHSTRRRDTVDKRVIYAELGILEYWRFDETGEHYGTRLAGDRLVGGRYEPIRIDQLPDGNLRGHSAILNVELRWTDGRLGWHDPATGEHVATMASEREGHIQEREARIQEHAVRIQAEARAAAEQQARIAAEERAGAAETRVRELEDQLRQLRGE